MAFSLFGKRKKYPLNKQKKDLATGVYAGPEYFARRAGRIYAGPEPSKNGDAEVLDVYAGPEFDGEPAPPEEIGRTFDEDAPMPPEDEEEYDTVYAGPEPPEEPAPVYAGPERPERTALVYAGPEFFARRKAEKELEALASGVYAGPEPPPGGMMGMMGGPSPTPPEDEEKGDGEA